MADFGGCILFYVPLYHFSLSITIDENRNQTDKKQIENASCLINRPMSPLQPHSIPA